MSPRLLAALIALGACAEAAPPRPPATPAAVAEGHRQGHAIVVLSASGNQPCAVGGAYLQIRRARAAYGSTTFEMRLNPLRLKSTVFEDHGALEAFVLAAGDYDVSSRSEFGQDHGRVASFHVDPGEVRYLGDVMVEGCGGAVLEIRDQWAQVRPGFVDKFPGIDADRVQVAPLLATAPTEAPAPLPAVARPVAPWRPARQAAWDGPLEKALLEDARDGRLDTVDLTTAALIASGVPESELDGERRALEAALAAPIARARTRRDPAARGRDLLRALHETILVRYDAGATALDEVVHTGQFNCLSSAIVFVIAAQGLLDAPRAMLRPSHAYARVRLGDGRDADVETTSAEGFDVDSSKTLDPAARARAAASSTDLGVQGAEELPLLSLIAAVYSNRSVDLFERGDLENAAVASDRATRLAAGQTRARFGSWRANVLNDGAIRLVKAQRLDDARAMLELALEGAAGPARELLARNLARVHVGLASRAARANDWGGTLAQIELAEKLGELPSEDLDALKAAARGHLAASEGSDQRCRQQQAAEVARCLVNLAAALLDKGATGEALLYARRALALAPQAKDPAAVVFMALQAQARDAFAQSRCETFEALVREQQPLVAQAEVTNWFPQRNIASCWVNHARAASLQKDWVTSAQDLERARLLDPQDGTNAQHLASVELMRAQELAQALRCDEARPIVVHAVAADPGRAGDGSLLLESCADRRARQAEDSGDHARAALELRRGLADVPGSTHLRSSLGIVLHNLAVTLLRQQRCDEARALAPELAREGSAEALAAVRRACP